MDYDDVRRSLARANDNAHQAQSILEMHVGVELGSEQLLARAAIAAQLAAADATAALTASNLLLCDRLEQIRSDGLAAAEAAGFFHGYRLS